MIKNLKRKRSIPKVVEIEKPIYKIKKDSIIEINGVTLVIRMNRDGHIYYSSMYNGEEIENDAGNGHVYKKSIFRNKKQ